MQCHICSKVLSEKEVQWNAELEEWEPCGTCLEVIMDAAYCGRYDDEESRVVDPSFDDETLYGDSSDIWTPLEDGYE